MTGQSSIELKDTAMEKLVVEAYKMAKKPLHRKIRKKQFVAWAKSVLVSDPSPCTFADLLNKFNVSVSAGVGDMTKFSAEPETDDAGALRSTTEAAPSGEAAAAPAAATTEAAPSNEAAAAPAAATTEAAPSDEAAAAPAAATTEAAPSDEAATAPEIGRAHV